MSYFENFKLHFGVLELTYHVAMRWHTAQQFITRYGVPEQKIYVTQPSI